jgi:hypothetical protein
VLPLPTSISSTMLMNGTGITEPILKTRIMNAVKRSFFLISGILNALMMVLII